MTDCLPFCERCLEHEGSDREKPPHGWLIVRTRVSVEGARRQYICTNCTQVWERTVAGWRRWFKPDPLWEPEPIDPGADDETVIVPTELQ